MDRTLPCTHPYCDDGSAVGPDSVAVTVYQPPQARTQQLAVAVGAELAARAKAAGLLLSAEPLSTGYVACYARRPDQDPETEHVEIAPNTAGPDNPTEAMRRAILRALQEGAACRPDCNGAIHAPECPWSRYNQEGAATTERGHVKWDPACAAGTCGHLEDAPDA